MSYFERHIFFCTNQRTNGEACCADLDAARLRGYAKDRAKSLGLLGDGKCRVNSAGCLGRCEQGPVAVVYPDGVWYSYLDEADVDEILEKHLGQGEVVSRLMVDDVSDN